MKPIKAWWFSAERKLPNGDGRLIRVGRTHVHKGELSLCRSGFHASRRLIDALQYAPGSLLYRVECSGEILEGDDKLVCSSRKYLSVANVDPVLRKFARLCALDVIDKWDAPDVVVRYLKSGDESLQTAAWDAARAAAWDAARAAAWDAAWDAARAAAWDAARAAACVAARDAACVAARAAARAAACVAARAAARAAAWDVQNTRLTRMCFRAIRSGR